MFKGLKVTRHVKKPLKPTPRSEKPLLIHSIRRFGEELLTMILKTHDGSKPLLTPRNRTWKLG